MSVAGQGESARAFRLAAAAHAEQERLSNESDRWWRTMQARLLGGVRTRLSPDELEEAERIGRETPFDVVLGEVLGTNSGS